MEKYIKEFDINKNKYVFNGNTLDLFKITDQKKYMEYLEKNNTFEQTKLNSNQRAKIVLNVSNNCNLKCKYCYAEEGMYAHKNKGLMSAQTLDNVINYLKNLGVEEIGIVSLFGGEPLLNFPIIQKALSDFTTYFNVFNFEVVTNGYLLTEEIIKLFKFYNVNLSVSIDGPRECTDKLRGEGTFDKAFRALKLAQNANYPKLSASATYTKIHEDMGYSFEDIEEYFESIGVRATISRVLSNDMELLPEQSFDLERQRANIRDSLYKLENNIQRGSLNPFLYRTLMSLFLDTKSYSFCDDLDPSISLTFDYDGSIFNCFHFWGEDKYNVSDGTINSGIEFVNDKNNKKKCKECWARNLCKECTAAIMQGTLTESFRGDECLSADIYEVCINEILNLYQIGKLGNIKENFINNFLTYK